MKVSEAIDRLKVGDTVWVKGEVERIDEYSGSPLDVRFLYECRWFSEDDEISLTEPTKKVEIPLYVAEWIEFCKEQEFSLYSAMSDKHLIDGTFILSNPYQSFRSWLLDEDYHEEIFARAWLDGFTIEPKRWVVKIGDYHSTYIESLTIIPKLRYTLSEQEGAYKFTDKSKAKAVATLVEGSVEEV